ncbi:hypothetical protein J8L70_03170 [Pseudoalteromonas sp. MMG010]|nr:hypothetical protein [Pseudoalteromonas sp. MMG010]
MFFKKLTCLIACLYLLNGCDDMASSDNRALLNAQCAANQSCLFLNEVKIWLSDTQLSPETPFSIFIDLPAHYKITNSRLEGITMYMGYIPQQFKQKGAFWQSDTMVGVCAQENMLWNLEVELMQIDNQTQHTLDYYFYVKQ